MIIQIAFGVLLGYLFLFLLIIIMAGVCYVIMKLQEDEPDDDQIIRPRIRPERTRYEETQELKRRASERRPDHWGRK